MLPPRALVGMVHLAPLPGSPAAADASVPRIIAQALDDARVYLSSGFDALIVENMHDRPYVNAPHPPHTTAIMTAAAAALRAAFPSLPLGIQVLSAGHMEALAVAHAVDAAFIRVENFVFSHVADEGLMPTAAAGPLLRYRRAIGADRVRVFADIKKKHASHALTADLSISQAAAAAAFFSADALIVSGPATGEKTDPRDVAAARTAGLPVLVGSGVTPDQVAPLLSTADALIVGSFVKRDGLWSNPLDPDRCRAIANARP